MDPWEILDTYFRDHRYAFTKHHLDSYREFLRTHIPNTIRSYNPIVMIKEDDAGNEFLRVQVHIGGKDGSRMYIERPTIMDDEGKAMLLTPQEARLRNMTYATHIFADVEIEYFKNGASDPVTRLFEMCYIGSVPLMLHSDPCVLHAQGSKVLQAFGECPMDPGGYFVIDGKEKVIVSQERITTNRLFIGPMDDPNYSYRGMIRCTGLTGETALSPRTVEFLVIRYADTIHEPNVKEELRGFQGAILVNLPSIRGSVPLSTLFRALGIESDKQIVELICGPLEEVHPTMFNFLRPSFAHGASTAVFTMTQALEYLKVRTAFDSVSHVRSILATDVFPNMPESLASKASYLGYLVHQLMKTSLGILKPSDRDSYVFKRVDISGFLLAQLFQDTYDKFRKHVRDHLDQEYYYGPWKNTNVVEDIVRVENISRIFPGAILTDIFTRSLKGMWGTNKEDPDQGKVQDLARISYIGFLSHLRRVNMPLDRSIKITSPHRLHSQQWGIMCPFESPDGASIGYLKNFALMTQITFGTSTTNIEKCLDDLGIVERLATVLPHDTMSTKYVRVLINGVLFGVTTKPHVLSKAIRLFRRNGLLNPFVSVSWNISENELRIQSEPGRPCRPLLIVHEGQVLYTNVATKYRQSWFSLVFGSLMSEEDRNEGAYYIDRYKSPFVMSDFAQMNLDEILRSLEKTQACIEYLDIEEENTMYIGMNEKDVSKMHTHLEIHPSTLFSVVTQIVPFANHNQAPRVIFHGAQSKQAIGVYATNFRKRFDTMSYIQHYPQKRIVTTRGAFYNGAVRMPNGANVIVAVATYTGFNQEDGIIMNKTSVDRGLFHITAYKTMTATEKTLSPRERLIFANPIRLRDDGKKIEGIKHANYQLLGENGIIKEEAYIPRGQEAVVLGMLHVRQDVKEERKGVFTEQKVEESYRDVSMTTDVHHYGKVDRVFVATQNQGVSSRIAKVRFRKVRRPELGDKACSMHGQKGVVGMLLPQEDMPYTKDGIVPDLIINPHAFPSRMTIGHLVETVVSKLSCLQGSYADGTVFLPFDVDKVYSELEERGFDRHGNEILYNGRTGQQIHTEIFMGPIYYYRLKHMVTDKIHARGDGPRVLLTHQPTSGRSKLGGLRIGEMERDVLLAHGLSQFTKEHMMEKSDKYRWAVCRHCGVLAKYAPQRGIYECHGCARQDLAVVETPYSFKLLVQEMEAMGVQIRLSDMEPPLEEEEDKEVIMDIIQGGSNLFKQDSTGNDGDNNVIEEHATNDKNNDEHDDIDDGELELLLEEEGVEEGDEDEGKGEEEDDDDEGEGKGEEEGEEEGEGKGEEDGDEDEGEGEGKGEEEGDEDEGKGEDEEILEEIGEGDGVEQNGIEAGVDDNTQASSETIKQGDGNEGGGSDIKVIDIDMSPRNDP